MNKKRFEELIEQIRKDLNDDERYGYKILFIRERVEHYSIKLGFTKEEILEAFEKKRTFWSGNYYQEANFPYIEDKVKVFETLDELLNSIKAKKFICPACEQIQSNPYNCKSGYVGKNGNICNWESKGLLGTMNKGFFFTVKELFLEEPIIDECFMPIEFVNSIYNPDYQRKEKLNIKGAYA